ncbi:MAG: CoA transferase [Pseudomonadota bacterium]|nr:CoA transferase [Pseudomonadota bacterium]
MTNASGPLTGIRVVDLTTAVSGPVAAVILADQGADVIKIEPPGGDFMRAAGPEAGMNPTFVACNHGKRSIVLDLKQQGAADILWRLIESADVLIQNFRPGAVERLGFGASTVAARNPRLIYLSISGVGESGPYSGKRVYDPVIQALGGLADIQADPQTGRPRMVRTLIADKTTAVYGAQAVVAALFSRERTGVGQHVRLSMLDTLVCYLWPEAMTSFALVDGAPETTAASAHDMIFVTANGYMTLGAVSDREWHALCEVLGRREWIDDVRFCTAAARSLNRQERLNAVEGEIQGRTTEDLIAALDAADVPCAPVLTRVEMMTDPQVEANELIVEIDQPGLGRLRQARSAARFEGTPSVVPSVAPMLGEHTAPVLSDAGYTIEEIAAWHQSGVVFDGVA